MYERLFCLNTFARWAWNKHCRKVDFNQIASQAEATYTSASCSRWLCLPCLQAPQSSIRSWNCLGSL